MNRFFAMIATLVALVFAPAAQASDWYLAETENFRLYSYGDEDDTIGFAQDLERLDQAMRILSGIGPASEPTPDYARLTIYRFGEASDMGELLGVRSVGGFFIPRAGQSVGFVPRRADRVRGLGQRATGLELDPQGVLFHEYAHYFMYAHAPAAYPMWFSEGFAEFFYTIELEDDRFTIGQPPPTRAYSLGRMRVDTEKMFNPDPADRRNGLESERTYGHGWLLSSHLLLAPDRRGQLDTYLRLLNQGTPSLEAAETAFGDLGDLDDELESYRRSAARLVSIPYYDESEPAVTIRMLDEGEASVMRMVIRSKAGVTEDMAADQVNDARRAIGRYPDNVAVLMAATEVEFDAGNIDEAEVLAQHALELDPQQIGAAVYLGDISLRRAADDPEQYSVARRRYLAANAIDATNPRPLAGFYLTYVLAGETPTENAALALETAFAEAPYDTSLRQALGHLLLTEDRDPEAYVVMTPTINNPHNTAGLALRDLFDSDDPADRAELLGKLQPRPYGYEPPEDEDGDDD